MTLSTSRLCSLAAALLLAACASAPTRYYTLSAPLPDAAVAQTPPIFIEVMPVAVPERLARPQLVVRPQGVQNARVEILEQDRWSSPFNNELRDALAGGIANRLGAVDVTRGGRPSSQAAYRIAVELRHYDAVPGAQVQATFGWTITRSDDSRSAACQLSVTEAVNGAGMDALALGVQRAVAAAAAAISANVTALQANRTVQCGG
ncbi:PqiC family protein [Paraherbaspirillum soli]|uniref:Membrane integrity-associated transporter subunit PqiC n=1 Tax=Paraherbaspirillum soli TaxID=631222 RepID=A0ABW0MFG5_9BURK